jgi:hypothetical protein
MGAQRPVPLSRSLKTIDRIDTKRKTYLAYRAV